MKIKQPEIRRARIEIIPMIDTIFFLLVFFMITWIAMVKMNGMGTLLPRPATAGAKAPASVTLSLAASGQYYIDSHRATEAGWAEILRQRLAAKPDSLVVINIAPVQKTQALISVLDSVNHIIEDMHSHAQVLIATPRIGTTGPEPPDAQK